MQACMQVGRGRVCSRQQGKKEKGKQEMHEMLEKGKQEMHEMLERRP